MGSGPLSLCAFFSPRKLACTSAACDPHRASGSPCSLPSLPALPLKPGAAIEEIKLVGSGLLSLTLGSPGMPSPGTLGHLTHLVVVPLWRGGAAAAFHLLTAEMLSRCTFWAGTLKPAGAS